LLFVNALAADATFADRHVLEVACRAVGEHAAVAAVVATDALEQHVIVVECDAGAGMIKWVVAPPLGMALAAGVRRRGAGH
jgi:hypothetical protein